MKALKQNKHVEKRSALALVQPEFIDKTQDQWEELLFRNAAYFTVYRKLSRGKSERKEFANFPEAAVDAFHDHRALVYAVAESGRFVCVVRSRWQHYLDIWKEMNKVETQG